MTPIKNPTISITKLFESIMAHPFFNVINLYQTKEYQKIPELPLSTLDIPRNNARWVLAKHFHGNESCKAPYLYDIQENHTRLGRLWD